MNIQPKRTVAGVAAQHPASKSSGKTQSRFLDVKTRRAVIGVINQEAVGHQVVKDVRQGLDVSEYSIGQPRHDENPQSPARHARREPIRL